MFCPQCGANNDNAARHCNQCGANLVGPAQQPLAPPPPPPMQPVYGAPIRTPGTPLPAGTVPNYMVQSILVTLCCCLPLGIVGIVKAGEVNNRLAVGDYDGALKASRTVRTILWIGFVFGILSIGIWGFLSFVGGMSHMGHSIMQ